MCMLLAKNYDFRSRTTCSILYKGCMKIQLSIQVWTHYLPQISIAQRSILAIHSIGGPFKLVSLSLLRNLGVALLCSIFIVATGPVYCVRARRRHTRFVCGWFRPDFGLII